VRRRGCRGRRVRPLHALFNQWKRPLARSVPTGHRMSGGKKPGHDDLSHRPKTNETNFHKCSSSYAARNTVAEKSGIDASVPDLAFGDAVADSDAGPCC